MKNATSIIEALAEKFGFEILVDHCNGKDFSYFVYKGQKIWIEQPGINEGGELFWTLNNALCHLEKMLTSVAEGKRYIHFKIDYFGDYFSFVWGEREPLGAFDFYLNVYVAKAERGISILDLRDQESIGQINEVQESTGILNLLDRFIYLTEIKTHLELVEDIASSHNIETSEFYKDEYLSVLNSQALIKAEKNENLQQAEIDLLEPIVQIYESQEMKGIQKLLDQFITAVGTKKSLEIIKPIERFLNMEIGKFAETRKIDEISNLVEIRATSNEEYINELNGVVIDFFDMYFRYLEKYEIDLAESIEQIYEVKGMTGILKLIDCFISEAGIKKSLEIIGGVKNESY